MQITIEEAMNLCFLIHKYGEIEGVPLIVEGKCNGYQADERNDEPCETCMNCRFNVHYEEEPEFLSKKFLLAAFGGKANLPKFIVISTEQTSDRLDGIIPKLNESTNGGIEEFIFKPSYVELGDYALINHWKKPSILSKTIDIQKQLKKPYRIRGKRVKR